MGQRGVRDGQLPEGNGKMWYPDQRDITREEDEDKQKTYDYEKQTELDKDDETSESDYQYTDWASI